MAKYVVFFLSIGVLFWMLYPRSLFLGYIYEGKHEYAKAEQFYLRYLVGNPSNKIAISRLTALYERSGEPERETLWLESLFRHRPTDWNVARSLLTHYEETANAKASLKTYIKIAKALIRHPRARRGDINELLEKGISIAIWEQSESTVQALLDTLIIINPENSDYREDRLQVLRSTNQVDLLLDDLNDLIKHPKPEIKEYDLHEEIITVLMIEKRYAEAHKAVNAAIKFQPKNYHWYRWQASIFQAENNWPEAVAALENIKRKFPALTLRDLENLNQDLLGAYLNNKQYEEALGISEAIIQFNPDNQSGWEGRIAALYELQSWENVVPVIEAYMERFPEDLEQYNTMVEVLVYKLQNLNRLPLMLDYIKKTNKTPLAMDIGYLLDQKGNPLGAINWLLAVKDYIKTDNNFYELLADLYIRTNNKQLALNIYSDLYKNNPKNKDYLLTYTFLAFEMDNKDAAIAALKEYGSKSEPNAENSLLVGRELLFLEQYKESVNYLSRAIDLNRKSPLPWFWRSEAYAALNRNSDSKADANEVINIMGNIPPNERSMRKIWLKSQSRIKVTPQLVTQYEEYLKKYPNDFEVLTENVNFLLTARKVTAAREILASAHPKTQTELDSLHQLNMAADMQEYKWRDALSDYDNIYLNSHKMGVRLDASRAAIELRDWPLAYKLLHEELPSGASKKEQRKALRIVKPHLENSIALRGQHAIFGGQSLSKVEVSGHTWLGKLGELNINANTNRATIAGTSTQQAQIVKAALTKELSDNLQGRVGAEFGHSPHQNTPTGTLGATFFFGADGQLSADAEIRELRTDLAQAILAGVVKDELDLAAQIPIAKRLMLLANYQVAHNTSSLGGNAIAHEISPGLQYAINSDPFVGLTYQYIHRQTSSNGAFLANVPLVTDLRTHQFTLFTSIEPLQSLLLEASIFAGEDAKRNLHLFEGDLWGGNARMSWEVASTLDVNAGYTYSRESGLTGGEYQEFSIGLVTHWK